MTQIRMFDKSQLQKRLVYFGDKNEAHLLIRSRETHVATYLHHKDAWMYDEPDKDRNELARLEAWFDDLRAVHCINPKMVFNTELLYISEDVAWTVALTQFRRAVVLGVPVDNSSLHKLREYVCDGPDGVDDLLDMKPFTKEKKAVAEYDAVVDGDKISGVLSE